MTAVRNRKGGVCFLEIITVKGTKCNQTATIIRTVTQQTNMETITEGWGQVWRWSERPWELFSTCPKEKDAKRYRKSICQHPEWTCISGGRGTAVLWLRACPQICCHEEDTCSVTKKKYRIREKTQRIQCLIALPCSRWNWNHSPSGWI